MLKIVDYISEEMKRAFIQCGYDEKYGVVSVSNRPDLCQYQCNGAMAAAKQEKVAPILIAERIVDALKGSELFARAEAVKPGFINLSLSQMFLSEYLSEMAADERLGCDFAEQQETIVIDYGGANIAKPLHVGHLRSAVRGESIKRMFHFMGHKTIGDAHLGDWGLPMGLIIAYLKEQQPELPYFNENFQGDYPEKAPFTISELELIYPEASKRSKADEEFLKEAQETIYRLQHGDRGYLALWQHIQKVSVVDIRRVYDDLNVNFELWKKESDAVAYIPDLVEYLKTEGYAHISEGALVVDVKEDTDTKEMPPCMILKSNGASLYDTTDLATIVERVKLFHPNHIVYVVDKRQELYFERVFRCARKAKLVDDSVKLSFIGFGTMNGSDGKPFKTRDGGVMRLDSLIESINNAVLEKINSNREMEENEAAAIAKIVGLAALKYGDLSNQSSKDYVFDVERFISFDGNTGPYILYMLVRIKSILAKLAENQVDIPNGVSKSDRVRVGAEAELMLSLARFNDMLEHAAEEMAPNKVCQYIFEVANTFSSFYHESIIITETDKEKQREWIELVVLTQRVLSLCVDLLGMEVPDKM